MDSKFRSRKFLLALSGQVVSHVGLFTGFIDAGIWLQTQIFIVGLYGVADIAEQKVNPEKYS